MSYVQLAKLAIKEFVETKKIISVPKNLPKELYEKKCGVFVSIHLDRDLRGCIGTYLPVHENLAEEIILNAVAACSRDSRFPPIRPDELEDLSIEVSLLHGPKKVSNPDELDPKKYGVIAKCQDGRCGLLLPDLDGIDSASHQISIACQKGGIDPAVDEKIELFKFEVDKYSE